MTLSGTVDQTEGQKGVWLEQQEFREETSREETDKPVDLLLEHFDTRFILQVETMHPVSSYKYIHVHSCFSMFFFYYSWEF